MDDVAITIVNYKMKEDTLACLTSLFTDISETDLKITVVVADNDSGDDIVGLLSLHFPQVKTIALKGNFGFGGGQNRAMKAVPARYYFLVNPDIVFPSGQRSIEELYKWMEAHPKVGMVGPQLRNRDGSLQYSCYRFPSFLAQPSRRLGLHVKYKWASKGVDDLLMKDFDHQRTIPVDWLMGSALFVRGEALADVGGFDERYFMYFEDCDWARRFWEARWPVYYMPEIKLIHGHRRASASVPGLKAVLVNPLTRIHVSSWIKYFWKWRGKKI